MVKKRQDSPIGPIIAEYLIDVTGQKGLLSHSKAYTAQGTVEVYNVTYDARNRLTQQNWIVPGTDIPTTTPVAPVLQYQTR